MQTSRSFSYYYDYTKKECLNNEQHHAGRVHTPISPSSCFKTHVRLALSHLLVLARKHNRLSIPHTKLSSSIPAKRTLTSAAPMPSLGFLKKKKTKDSQGSNNPTSPTGSPLSPTLTKTSNFFSEPESTTTAAAKAQANSAAAPSPSTTPAASTVKLAEPMNAGSQLQGTNPTANTQDVPSIQHLANQPNYAGNGSQHDSAYSSGGSNAGGTPTLNLPQQKATANAVRETKGKYTLTDFNMERTLGTGSFGRVHLVQSKHNQRYYAVKVLKKAQVVKMKQVEHTNDERRMLQRCKHPFLITLWGTFQDSKNLYMVMDFIEGGELFSLLRKSQVSNTRCIKFGR